MNKKRILFLLFLLVGLLSVEGQTLKGYIIGVENGVVNVDFTKSQVSVGDRLEVVTAGGFMTHPVTGRRVKKEDTALGVLTVQAVYSEYSVARPLDASLLQKLKPTMVVRKTVEAEVMLQEDVRSDVPSLNSNLTKSVARDNFSNDRVSIVIAPAQVNDVVSSGHFGGYVADILMEQMLMCDKVRLLDRSVLGAQVDEINLAGDLLDPSTTIKRGKGIGARYVLQTTMQKPDVANVKTGIPLASIMGAAQGLSGRNLGAAYASNMEVATLKAAVNISVRVVDLQTGEVVFMCSGSGKAKGKSQLSMEYGALGGGQLNGGAEDFKQTVTGKAIQQAFMKIGRNLKDYFNGNTDKKVMGSVSGGHSYGEKMHSRGYKLYMGTERLRKDEIPAAFNGHDDLYFKYRNALKKKRGAWWVAFGGTAASCILAGIIIGEGASEENGIKLIGGGGTALSIICAIAVNKSGRKAVKRITESYNQSNSKYGNIKEDPYKYSFALSPTGLRFTF